MFVQAQVTPETETTVNEVLGEELINWDDNPFVQYGPFSDVGTVTQTSSNTFNFVGVGNNNNTNESNSTWFLIYRHMSAVDSAISYGEKVLITMTVSNYSDLDQGGMNNASFSNLKNFFSNCQYIENSRNYLQKYHIWWYICFVVVFNNAGESHDINRERKENDYKKKRCKVDKRKSWS